MDHIVHAVARDGQVRVFAAQTTETVACVRKLHAMNPPVAVAVGRTLSAAVMIGAMQKRDGTVTIRVCGDGPIGTITAVADALGNVRAYADRAHVDASLAEDIARAVGNGSLTITKNAPHCTPYQGVIALVRGNISDDIATYFAASEQTPTAVGLDVYVDHDRTIAGGWMIQCLPGAHTDLIDDMSRAVHAIAPSQWLPEKFIRTIDPHARIVGRTPVAFRCVCDERTIARAMCSLGRDVLQDLMQEDVIELVCHECNTTHFLTREQRTLLLQQHPVKQEDGKNRAARC